MSDLSLEQKAALLSGRDFWTTKQVGDVPAMVLVDGPHGLRVAAESTDIGIGGSLPATCFPPAVAVGAGWDPEIAAAVGAAVGREARAAGVAVNLGPGVNIKRSPLCGRNFEYYSEDPLLSGVLATAHVRALQETGVGASVKHFAANNQETDRMRVSADVDERTLREIYFPAFERVVTQAHPATVMCSYNRVNGVHAAENHWLLTTVLRDEWGFEGVVVSDWGAVRDRVAALAAGLDLEMPGTGGTTDAEIVRAVGAGELAEAVVDRSVARVRALASRAVPAAGSVDVDEHHALARRLAAECVVLLKNSPKTLPVDPQWTVAVVGDFATEPRFQGGGSSHVNPTRVDTPVDAIRATGATIVEPRDADVTVVFAGLPEAAESEGHDRETLDLPAGQVALIREVAAVSRRTVVVLSHGGVVSLEGWHDEVDAILDGFLLGQAAGGALADVLYGVVNPSGHLAESIPLRLKDSPSYLNFPGEQGHVRYGEGVMVGYRYYATADVPVRYPFGHGLSYTTFETTDLTVTPGTDTATVAVTVTNTGARAGKHVVQVYVSTDAGPVRRPARELRAFTKLALEPGESQRVELPLDRRAFAYYDVELARWVVAPGDYTVHIGHNAHDTALSETIALAGDEIVRPVTLDSTVGEWFAHPVVGPVILEKIVAGMGDQAARAQDNPETMRMLAAFTMRQFANFLATAGNGIPPEDLTELVRVSER
jgi:beta-glucosidase